ncbi:hypothetical protein OQA88_11055 [Cercophora sp. LCS_1]
MKTDGNKGYQMARNLQAKLSPSDSVRLFDINTASAERLAKEMHAQTGGAVASVSPSLQEATQDADTIITCLPEPVHVHKTYTTILSTLSPSAKRLLIDTSTIDPSTSRTIASLIPQTHGTFIDSPMSGGVVGATNGTLTFMLGSPPSLFPQIEPVLLRMGKKVLHCGPQGSGLAAKLANNYLLAIQNIGAAEAMNMGVKLGLDPKVLAGVINVSTGRCWSTEVNNPVPGVVGTAPAGRGYGGGFGIGLMRKDLRLAVMAAREAGARLELADKVGDVYEVVEGREGAKDFSVVYKWLKE